MAVANKKVRTNSYASVPDAMKRKASVRSSFYNSRTAEPKTKWKLQKSITIQIALMIILVLGTAALLLIQQNQLYQTKRELNAMTTEIQQIHSSIDAYQNELDFDLDMRQIKTAAVQAGLRSPRAEQIKKIDFAAFVLTKEEAPIVDQNMFWTPSLMPSSTPNALVATTSAAAKPEYESKLDESAMNATSEPTTSDSVSDSSSKEEGPSEERPSARPTHRQAETSSAPSTAAPLDRPSETENEQADDGEVKENQEPSDQSDAESNEPADVEDWAVMIPEEGE